jgi:hypothetical protein
VQQGINFIQNKVTTLEKTIIFFGEQYKCFFQNLFSDGRFVLINIPLNVDGWLTTHNNKNV